MKITSTPFGKIKDGRPVQLFTLSNDRQVTVKVTNYGCTVTAIEMPDRRGAIGNIVCGFEKLDDYLSGQYLNSYPYFGCVVGRYANRISKGKYTIDGVEYRGVVNNGENHLHGGLTGFDRKLWTPEIIETPDLVGVKMSYLSPDQEEGYPGNLKVSCTYSLDHENNLTISYEAETDQATIINLTNHTYFNLTGGKDNILNHGLRLTAKKITEARELIPTGKILPVDGSPFDFTKKKTLGRDLPSLPEGYDQNFVIDHEAGKLVEAGCLSESNSGREVWVYTTQPGMQLYTGYWIPELIIDGLKKFGKYSGVALETQHYADSPNHDNFPSTLLRPGEKYKETTVYRFSVNE
ncbi:MAG: galactose mutarotase [Mangrovibacterium sp.]|nr:galactose mutarotase [Mangrovibacterium sp.]